MKKYAKPLLALAAILALVVLIATYFPNTFSSRDNGNNNASTTPHQKPNTKPTPTRAASSAPGATTSPPQNLASIPRPPGATLSQIAYVHDGDTLFLQPEGTYSRDDQIKVRLLGLDTPEVGEFGECFGTEARDYLRRMLPEGTTVWITPDREEFDKFGRSLLYLWTMDDRSVNLDLVEKGYATAMNIAPSNWYWKQFAAAEQAAYTANLGLWGSC